METDQLVLRDLVYFDFEKAASLFSQVEGGLLQKTTSETGETKDSRNLRKYDLKVFKPEFGGISSENSSQIESRILHHDLLIKVEQILFDNNYALDINQIKHNDNINTIRSEVNGFSYAKAEGWGVIEDYEKIKYIASNFNNIAAFIGQCAHSSLKDSPEFQELQNVIGGLETDVKKEKDKQKKRQLISKINATKEALQNFTNEATNAGNIDEWLIDGMKLFIDVFLSDCINLRIYPFETIPSFQLLANLKRNCFVDSNIENLIFAYGTKPNLKLTILGLITSLPQKDTIPFNPMQEFEELPEEDDNNQAGFESGFRAIFNGMEGFEKMVRFSRYPNVTVYPIAVYRTIKPNTK